MEEEDEGGRFELSIFRAFTLARAREEEDTKRISRAVNTYRDDRTIVSKSSAVRSVILVRRLAINIFTIRDDIVKCIRYVSYDSATIVRGFVLSTLIEPRPSSPSFGKNRRDSCRALQRLWIAQKTAHHSRLLYASHRAYFSVRCCARFAEEKERGEGDKRGYERVLGRWERPGGERRKKTRVRGLKT